jgi:hypothetical protein
MYRWVNLRRSFQVVGETQPVTNYPTRLDEPPNFPDSESNGKQFNGIPEAEKFDEFISVFE